MRSGALWLLAVVVSWPAAAQTSPYAGWEDRPIKALSAEEIAAYEQGEGMGLALAAELNRHPGPKHVLELQQELALTDEQLAETRQVFETMQSRAIELGRGIVEAERRLDTAFAAGDLGDEALRQAVTGIAELQGQLRVAHLAAHLRMVEILTDEQVARYEELRGYAGGEHHDHHMHHPS